MAAQLPDERRRLVAASNARWRVIFAALAVVLPLLLGGLFRRQSLRLRALADHGRRAEATVVDRRSGGAFYRYDVAGHTYDWNVRAGEVPFPVGAVFPVTFLPEAPSLSRPVWPYTAANYEAERHPGILYGFPTALFVLFALMALLCHRALVRSRAGLTQATPRPIPPELAGRLFAGLILATVLSVNLYDDVQAVHRALWGDAVAGLPTVIVVSLVELVLFAPLFWVFPAMLRVMQARLAAGGSFTKGDLIMAVVTAGPEQRRARNIIIAGTAYFALIAGLWIAYTDWRGV